MSGSQDLRDMADELDEERDYLERFLVAVKAFVKDHTSENRAVVERMIKHIESGTFRDDSGEEYP
jgi:hypothetical protein